MQIIIQKIYRNYNNFLAILDDSHYDFFMKKLCKRKPLIDVKLPKKGQCTYYNDDWTICTKSISSGAFCAYHAKICYTGVLTVSGYISATKRFNSSLPQVGISDLFKAKNGGNNV